MSTIFKHEVTPAEKILNPFQNFMKVEAGGGIVLLICTLTALAWANSPWSHSYEHLWETNITIGFGSLVLSKALHHWINDGLMAIFFMIVGLEIKREILVGELASIKKALLPIAAAVGGMVVPAMIYFGINYGGAGSSGWGVPMATDIAFALGVLTVLGKRVPSALKVFLLALAIVDDLGAVIVIALFYTSGVVWSALAVGAVILVVLIICNMLFIRNPYVYYVLGVFLWLAFLKSGIHATIAGVLIALTIPTRTRIRSEEFLARSTYCLYQFSSASFDNDCVLSNEEKQSAIHALESVCEKVNSPALRIEHALHPWVTYAIMPIFALANAGVHLGGDLVQSLQSSVSLGIILGLVAGKPIGIALFSWFAVKSGLAAKPDGLSWGHILGGGFLGGIGFTMSIFIANLAYGQGELLTIGKIGILIASLLSGIIGSILLLTLKPANAESNDLQTNAEAGATAGLDQSEFA